MSIEVFIFIVLASWRLVVIENKISKSFDNLVEKSDNISGLCHIHHVLETP